MTRKYILICSLLCFCGSLLSFISSAGAQGDCTPVVYAFRHAEDVDYEVMPFPCLPGSPIQCTTALTPLGMKHADLYRDEMIPNFETAQDYCAVEYVLSVSPIIPDNPGGGGHGGTTNPFFTAKPLAIEVMDSDPIVTIGSDVIDEKLTGKPDITVTPEQLHDYLIGITQSGSSVALFWTSEGLHDLSKALGTDIIPKKAPGVPPRNAAYVFKYNGSSQFTPPAKATEYVQCFNYKVTNGGNIEFYPNPSTPLTRYYCGKPERGNLDPRITEAQFPELHARICATDGLTPSGTSGYYGYCSPP